MSWETRGRSDYYYRAYREGGRVRKEYYGRGCDAELAALLDETERQENHDRRERWRAEHDSWKAGDDRLEALDAAVNIAVRGALLAASFRQHHRGEWRRRRGERISGQTRRD